jgi:hypothetical protein
MTASDLMAMIPQSKKKRIFVHIHIIIIEVEITLAISLSYCSYYTSKGQEQSGVATTLQILTARLRMSH